MIGRPSLLEIVQGLLERTYRMPGVVRDVGRYVIGDHGYRRMYAANPPAVVAGHPSAPPGARTLVRETADGVRACIYYPDVLIACLEAHPPQRGVGEVNIDAFAALVEELDHLLCIAERASQTRAVSLFELELHADVSKYLVLARFMAGKGETGLAAPHRAWLRWQLFEKGACREDDPRVRARYRDAARLALKLLRATDGMTPTGRLGILREFHRADAAGKVGIIERFAA